MRRPSALIALVALLLLLLPGTAHSQGDDEGGSGDTGAVALVSQTTWIEPDGEIRLRLDVDGAAPTDRLTVALHGRLLGRFQLAASVRGDSPGRQIRTIADGSIAELDPDGNGQVDVQLGLRAGAGDADRLLLTQEGLHPVHVTLTTEDGAERTRFVTHVARVPDEVEQTLGVAVVQPLTTELSLQPDGTVDIADATRARLTQAAAVFGEAPVPLTYTLHAEVLTALHRSGNLLDGQLVTALADTVDRGTVAATTFVDVDPDALVRSDVEHLLTDQLERGTLVADLHLEHLPDATTWIADADLGPAGLEALRTAGVARAVVPHASLEGQRPDLLVQPFALRAGTGHVTALATDPGLQAHLTGPESDALDVQHLLADLAAIWFERPAYARGTVVVLPDGVLAPRAAAALMRGLSEAPLLEVGSVDEVVAAADPAAADGIDARVEDPDDRLVLDLAASSSPRLPSGYRAELARTRDAVDSFRSVFPDADEIAARYDERLATSVASDLEPGEALDQLVAVREDIDARNANIGMPDRGAITLPSRDGVIPLTLVNNTGEVATVVVTFASDKLEFPDGGRMELTLTEPQTPIEVPVRALASGAFPLEMSLESPDGRTLFVESRYTVRSTAVSGLGIVLSVTAVVVLGAWWIRTARRARAAHRAAQ